MSFIPQFAAQLSQKAIKQVTQAMEHPLASPLLQVSATVVSHHMGPAFQQLIDQLPHIAATSHGMGLGAHPVADPHRLAEVAHSVSKSLMHLAKNKPASWDLLWTSTKHMALQTSDRVHQLPEFMGQPLQAMTHFNEQG